MGKSIVNKNVVFNADGAGSKLPVVPLAISVGTIGASIVMLRSNNALLKTIGQIGVVVSSIVTAMIIANIANKTIDKDSTEGHY